MRHFAHMYDIQYSLRKSSIIERMITHSSCEHLHAFLVSMTNPSENTAMPNKYANRPPLYRAWSVRIFDLQPWIAIDDSGRAPTDMALYGLSTVCLWKFKYILINHTVERSCMYSKYVVTNANVGWFNCIYWLYYCF